MTCPICGGSTRTINSRPKNDTVYRRRQCINCGHRFNTYEFEEDLIERSKTHETHDGRRKKMGL